MPYTNEHLAEAYQAMTDFFDYLDTVLPSAADKEKEEKELEEFIEAMNSASSIHVEDITHLLDDFEKKYDAEKAPF